MIGRGRVLASGTKYKKGGERKRGEAVWLMYDHRVPEASGGLSENRRTSR